MSIVQKTLEKIADAVVREGELSRAELRAGFQQTSGAVRLEGARPIQINMTTPVSQLLWGGTGRLLGWTLRNGGGAGNIAVDFRNGRDDSADLLATVSIGSNSAWQQGTVWLGPSGVSITDALWIDPNPTGGATLIGCVYIGAVD